MKYLDFVVLNTSERKRVTQTDIDPAEQAGVIDRSLLPVVKGERGWALNRKSGYFVAGEIGAKRAVLTLIDETVPVATLGICMHSRTSSSLWQSLIMGHANAELLRAPAPPWAALRLDVPPVALPDWLHWWAEIAAFTVLTREGW